MKLRLASAALLLMLALVGCGDVGTAVRTTTYPSNFEYIGRKELRTEMGKLAKYVAELNEILRRDEPSAPDVTVTLEKIEGVAQRLRSGSETTNHPRLDKNLEMFIRDVQSAKQAVDTAAPNYFMAGSIAGACLYCHR